MQVNSQLACQLFHSHGDSIDGGDDDDDKENNPMPLLSLTVNFQV